jgi:hypothetical protein
MSKIKWYHFWRPASGFGGGVIMGTILYLTCEFLKLKGIL